VQCEDDGRVVADHRLDGWAWRESGVGPVALFLHGLGGSRLSWQPQLDALSNVRRMVCWDLPGYGDADPLPETTFATLAAAVDDFATAIGADVYDLVGISFGGMIAQYVAAQSPRVRTLAIMASSPKFGLDGTDPLQWRADRLAPLERGETPAEFAHAVLSSLVGPDTAATVVDEQAAAMSRIDAQALARSVECVITHDSRDLLAKIDVPTYVMVGEDDKETPVSYSFALADAIHGARLCVIPHAGHLLNAEAPAEVNTQLRNLWSGR
jgi:3-oxoadipate enol-lactonase